MDPVSQRRWVERRAAPAAAEVTDLVDRLQISRLTARLLLSRGVLPAQAAAFLRARLGDLPDPFLLPDMDLAVTRLTSAVRAQQPIAIHGDYDVDGISGTALLVEGLRALGAQQVSWHIPLRLRDGYGLSGAALHAAAAAGVAVVVSVDCGVAARTEADLARELGLDLIITDHHQLPDVLPQALALVNPQRSPDLVDFTDLAGVGVGFFLLVALRARLREEGWFKSREEPDLRRQLDLVALGTIADLVPLRGVNRILTRAGLALLDAGSRPGVRALKQVAGVASVSTGVVGYQLAPRLNAAGRLEDAGRGVDLLLETGLPAALELARHLDRCNLERRTLEEQTFQAAAAMVAGLAARHTHALVLAAQGWHPGVVGIVASRLVERYHRPTVMIALDGERGKGSARSIAGFNLFQGLQQCAEHLEAFGGHAMAAGLSLNADQVEAFALALESQVRLVVEDEALVPSLRHDGNLLLEELDLEVMRELSGLAPFGMGNPEPLLVADGVRAMQVQVLQDKHLRFTACQGGYSHPAIAFGMAERRSEFQGEIDLLVAPQINSYRGRETVQLRVKDVRPSLING